MLLSKTRYLIAAVGLSLLAAIALASGVGATTVPELPRDLPIVDQTNTLSQQQRELLGRQIAEERSVSGNQLAVVMIPTLDGGSIEDYSLSVARQWGVGTNQNNNGILLLIVKNDRRLRIEVGTGLEGALTDAQSAQIMRNDLTPRFREGRYFEGIQAGLASIIAAIHGEYKLDPVATKSKAGFPWEGVLAFGFIGLSWLGSVLGRTKSWWAGGVIGGVAGVVFGVLSGSLMVGLVMTGILAVVGLVFDRAVSANYHTRTKRGSRPSWWAGGGFGGGGSRGGGGGFGGFGGGGFGGGGASGSW